MISNDWPASRAIRLIVLAFILLSFAGRAGAATQVQSPPNIILLTADDMAWFTPGCFGGDLAFAGGETITPNLDRLAAEGMRFERAHVTVAVCQPSRTAIMTGLYPHRSGAEGFHNVRPEVETLGENLRRAGYTTAILGKVPHQTPVAQFGWDLTIDAADLNRGRHPGKYHDAALDFMRRAAGEGKPFFLMANTHDPHRPFAGGLRDSGYKVAARPSRIYLPGEVQLPAFLPDIEPVRREFAEYCNSARRADDFIGAMLQAIEEAGVADRTLVMFLSDNGLSMPSAKTNCYLQSTRTPWIARWPGVIEPGRVDTIHLINGIDFTPTALDAAGAPPLAGIDGRSFLPLLRGEEQEGRDWLFTQYHETTPMRRYPMRAAHNGRFGYIWNAWSDGKREFQSESMTGRSFPGMEKAAEAGDAPIAARVEFLKYRAPEEFYDLESDPHCLHNLVDDPDHRAEVDRFRRRMEEWMAETGDPALEAFRKRDNPAAMAAFMEAQTERSRSLPLSDDAAARNAARGVFQNPKK